MIVLPSNNPVHIQNRKGLVCGWIVSLLAHVLFLGWHIDQDNLHYGDWVGSALWFSKIEARITSHPVPTEVPDVLVGDAFSIHRADSDVSTGQSGREYQQTTSTMDLETTMVTNPMASPNILSVHRETPDHSRFYLRSELSAPPVMSSWPDLDDAVFVGQNAEAIDSYRFRLYISQAGEVVRVQVVNGGGNLNEKLLAALKSTRFLPARLDGVAVNSQVEFELGIEEGTRGSSQVSDHNVRFSGLSG